MRFAFFQVRINLFRCSTFIAGVTLLFMVLLGTSLVMLPLVSKQHKASILNAVEEEAGSNNPLNEEHKNGKNFSLSHIDYSAMLGNLPAESISYVIPFSENIPDDLLAQTLIEPPDYRC